MQPPLKVAIIADSLALPRPPVAGRVMYEETYPVLLQKLLSSAVTDREVLVVERGQRFRTIVSTLDDWTEVIEYRNPHVAVVHVGIVDCAPRVFTQQQREWISRIRPAILRSLVVRVMSKLRPLLVQARSPVVYTDLATFEKTARLLVERACKSGVERLIMIDILTPTAELEQRSPGYTQNAAAYNSAMRRVCTDEGVALISFDQIAREAGGTAVITVDGMHPNPAGHAMLARSLCTAIAAHQTGRVVA